MLEKQNFIPEPEVFIAEKPLTPALKEMKIKRDKEICDSIAGRNSKLLVVIGPCSAHEPAPILEYVTRLAKVSEKVKDKLVIVPRSTPTNLAQRGLVIRGCFYSPILKEERILYVGFAVFAIYILQ